MLKPHELLNGDTQTQRELGEFSEFDFWPFWPEINATLQMP